MKVCFHFLRLAACQYWNKHACHAAMQTLFAVTKGFGVYCVYGIANKIIVQVFLFFKDFCFFYFLLALTSI